MVSLPCWSFPQVIPYQLFKQGSPCNQLSLLCHWRPLVALNRSTKACLSVFGKSLASIEFRWRTNKRARGSREFIGRSIIDKGRNYEKFIKPIKTLLHEECFSPVCEALFFPGEEENEASRRAMKTIKIQWCEYYVLRKNYGLAKPGHGHIILRGFWQYKMLLSQRAMFLVF